MRGKLKFIRVQNFKAVADSHPIKLTPLTVFIGNNGSGKSSIIEALQTLQRLVTVGLDGAMQPFKGMEYVRHKAVVSKSARREGSPGTIAYHAMRFVLRGKIVSEPNDRIPRLNFRSETQLNATGDADEYFIEVDNVHKSRKPIGRAQYSAPDIKFTGLVDELGPLIRRWQFLALDPTVMGEPAPTRRTSGMFLLDPSGANLADYLWHMVSDYRERGTQAWNSIVETLRFVLPYIGDVQPRMTRELERRSSLALQERFGKGGRLKFDLPGWMLSTGTMRVLALLAVFRHPEPPPLICIEEIENGLDPRTLNMIVDELKSISSKGRSQVILTTHSPYLLDLLPLSSIVVTEREAEGVRFWRPGASENEGSLKAWAERFRPGQLYTMGRLSRDSAEDK